MAMQQYQKRPVRFLGIDECNGWRVKIYSISVRSQVVNTTLTENAKQYLSQWLENISEKDDHINIATLILHEGNEGNFAIVSRWTGENMMQIHVYFSSEENSNSFSFFSGNGIVTCVWEMAVLWFERNAWVEHVLQKSAKPDYEKYLSQQMNADI